MSLFSILPLLAVALAAPPENPDSSTYTRDTVQLQEVRVAASIKETGPMRRQPFSATLMDKDALSAHHVSSLKEITGLVPNLFIPDYGSRLTSAIYVRGIGSRTGSPAVGLYVDDVPWTDKSAFDFHFYDIERVDVLRGPQGTLYGNNTMGGLVRIFTRNPLHHQGTELHLGYATGDNRRTASITHRHRLSDLWAISASGYYEGGSGFFRNDLTGRKADGVQAGGGRIRTVFQPNASWDLNLSVGYDYTDEKAYPYFYTGTVAAAKAGSETYPELTGKITANHDGKYRRGMLNAGLDVAYRGKGWRMDAVTAYQYLNDRMFIDQDFLKPDIYTLEQQQRIHTLTEEILLRSTTGRRWEWQSGAYLMYQGLTTKAPVCFYPEGLNWLEATINSAMPPMTSIPMLKGMGFTGMAINFRDSELPMGGSYSSPTLTAALFHQSTYRFTPRLTGTLGLRLDYEHQQTTYNVPTTVHYAFAMPNSTSPLMAVNLQDLSTDIALDGTLRDNRLMLLPRIALKYDFPAAGNLYASTSMGQRSGGYNLQMFSDILQSVMRTHMMQGVTQGVADYMEALGQSNPKMPKALPDPAHPGQTIPLAEYVRQMMQQNMPQPQETPADQVRFKPEYAWNIELGTHLNLSDRRLLIDGALFYNLIFNQQIARFAPTGLGRMMVNAGRSQSCGAEITAVWNPNRHLTFTGNYGYTHATFLRYDDGQGNDYAGRHVPFVPAHIFSAEASYRCWLGTKGIWKGSTLTLGADCTGTGRIHWTEDNSVSQPLYVLLGARATFTAPRFTLIVWGKNLTQKHYSTFYFESMSRGFEQHGKPLQVGVDLNLNF